MKNESGGTDNNTPVPADTAVARASHRSRRKLHTQRNTFHPATNSPPRRRSPARRPHPRAGPGHGRGPCRRRAPIKKRGPLLQSPTTSHWWSRAGSNRWPPACKAGALPAELRPRVVGLGGFEPPTSRLSGVRSNRLSYKPPTVAMIAYGPDQRQPTPPGLLLTAGRLRLAVRLVDSLVAENAGLLQPAAVVAVVLFLSLLDVGDGHHFVVLVQPHEPHALGGPALPGYVVDFHADHDALGADEHHFFPVPHDAGRHDGTVLLHHLQRAHAFAAAVGDAVFVQVGALAVAQLADDQQIRAGPHHVHGHHVVAVIQAHADDAPGGPAHGPHRVLGEAHGLALGGDQQDVLGAVGQAHVHQLVVLVQVDADEAVPGAVVLGQRRLLDDALLGGHDQEVILVVLLDRDGRLDPLIPRQVDEVYDGRAPGGAPRFGNVVAFHPVHFALVAEEQDVAVGAGDKQVLDEIVGSGPGRRTAPAAPPLRPVGRGGQPLDVAEVGHGNDHVFVGDEVLFLDLVGRGHDLGSPLVAVLLLDFLQLRADDLVDQVDVAENFPQPGDRLQQLLVFFCRLLALQPRQAAQLHVQDGDGLLVRQAGPLHQALLRLRVGLGRADGRDDLVDVVQGNAEPFQNVGPLL